MISDKHNVQDLIHLLKAHGIQHIVISPGSRNAPLTLSFDADPFFECYSVVDERSAAFFALGLAQQLAEPVVIVCTSGSAGLNYSPAVAEAFYQNIPLIVITADRPLEWIDQGDGQTIRQTGIFGSMLRFNANLPKESEDADTHWYNARLINQAILAAISPVPGPVHLNIPLNEPLYRQVESSVHKIKVIERIEARPLLDGAMLEFLAQELKSYKRILVLCGMSRPDTALDEALAVFARHSNVLVMTETISNLHNELYIPCIDRLLMSFNDADEGEFLPDLLITFGTNIISKKIKALLRKNKNSVHWHVSETGELSDTFQILSRIIPVEPFVFLEQLNEKLEEMPESGYGRKFRSRNEHCRLIQNEFIVNAPYSDLGVFAQITKNLPEDINLQMGNSSVVRYIQLFESKKSVNYFANRGTSGIDGSTSTAIGAAWVSNQPTLLISGDISFFYDSNALWNNYLSSDLKIIIINNGGGGIFRIIEGPESGKTLEKYFETQHERSASKLAESHGISYWSATNSEELSESFGLFMDSGQCGILEVFTPREMNDSVLKEHFKYIKERIKR